MSINQLINELKENEQDFEFYPTTKEMIKTIYEAAPSWGEWLDIGAGTCNFRKYFLEFAKEQQDRYNAKETAFRNSYKSGQGYNYDLQPNESDKAKGIKNYYVIEKSKILLEKMEKTEVKTWIAMDLKAQLANMEYEKDNVDGREKYFDGNANCIKISRHCTCVYKCRGSMVQIY